MAEPKASDGALKILRVLRQGSIDGYSLMAKIDLDEGALVDALPSLGDIVSVEGDLRKEKIGEAHISLLPSGRGLAKMMLGTLLFKRFE